MTTCGTSINYSADVLGRVGCDKVNDNNLTLLVQDERATNDTIVGMYENIDIVYRLSKR